MKFRIEEYPVGFFKTCHSNKAFTFIDVHVADNCHFNEPYISIDIVPSLFFRLTPCKYQQMPKLQHPGLGGYGPLKFGF
jgi:hypothetical protein